MRHVYPTDQIPHKWAHQLQEDARNPQGNLYFRGPTIYSYRDSWPLARIYLKGKTARRKHERRNLILDPCARTDWRLFGAFDAAGGNYWRIPGPCMLRVVDDEIITSLGARVPLAAAPMVWNLVQRARNIRAPFDRAWIQKLGRFAKIGDYPLDQIDADGTLHAGCHVIPYSEIASLARQLSLEGAK